MKILLTSELNGNPLIDRFYFQIKNQIDIEIGVKKFWNNDDYYDIIHIQWPEELFNWKNTSYTDLKKIIDRLCFWKNKDTKIIVTRHNIKPHKLYGFYDEIYTEIYKNSNGVIHLSNASLNDFFSRYEFSNKIVHEVIYHPIYDFIENKVNKNIARKKLGIPKNKKVILVFGAIRHEKEQQFIVDVFKKLDIEDKFIIVPRFYQVKPGKKQIFKRIKFEILKFLNNFNSNIMFDNKFINNEEIQYFMNASDIVFIPRFDELNSGVVLLAYSFNKIVVGPDIWSIGEMLKLLQNPVYIPGSVDDAAKKIKQGFLLQQKNINNFTKAQKIFNWESAIKKHLIFYERILK